MEDLNSAIPPVRSAPSLYSLPMYTVHAAPSCLFCAVVLFYSLDLLFYLRPASSYSLTGQNKLKLLIGFCPAFGWSFTLPPGKMGFVNERISCSAWGKRHALSKATLHLDSSAYGVLARCRSLFDGFPLGHPLPTAGRLKAPPSSFINELEPFWARLRRAGPA